MALLKDESDVVLDAGDAGILAAHTQASAFEMSVSTPVTGPADLPYDLPLHITLGSGYNQIWKAMKKMHYGKKTEVWIEMATHDGHSTWLNTLLEPRVKDFEPVATESQKKRKVEVDPPTAESEDNFADDQPKRKKRRRGKRGSGISKRSQKEPEPLGQDVSLASDCELPEEGELPEDKSEANHSTIASFHGTNGAQSPTELDKDHAEGVHPEVKFRRPIDDFEEEGAIRVTSDDESSKPLPNPKRRRTEQAMERRNISRLLAHTDVSVWSSLQRKFVCDGNHNSDLGLSLPKLDIQAIADAVEAGHESQGAYNQLGYAETPCEELQLIPTGELNGFVIYDAEGIPIVAHFPKVVKNHSKVGWNKSLVKLRRKATAGGSSTDSQGEGDDMCSNEVDLKREAGLSEVKKVDIEASSNQKRRTFRRFPTGLLHLSFSWKSLCENDHTNQLSKDTATQGGLSTHSAAVQEHFKEVGTCIMLQNYILYKLAPKSFQSHLKLRESLHQRFAAISTAEINNASLFSSRSYVYNEQINVQFREEDAIKGWTLLALAGTCETGRLALPGLGVKFDYRPGDLTFIRGRLIKCGVVDWAGDGNHICTVSSNHYSEWEVGEVRPVW